jgi:hypothetical protein
LTAGLIAAVVVFAVARSFLFSERLALLELLVPALFVVLVRRSAPLRRIVPAALGLLALVFLFFVVSELRRSYVYTHAFSAGNVSLRFVGYYLTSINNGFLVATHYRLHTPLYSVGQMFWAFPGVNHVVSYGQVFHPEPRHLWSGILRREGLNPDLFVLTLPGYLAADLSWVGIALLAALGSVSAFLHRAAQADQLACAFYGVWVVGLFELMRIDYLFTSRMAPVYLGFIVVYLLRRHARRERLAPVFATVDNG